jgi:RND superfamily putative drug exporter
MGRFLHNLGIFFFTKKWWVIAFWVVILAILGTGAGVFYKPVSNAISIPGTEAQVAIDRVAQLFPSTGKGSGTLVYHTTDKKVSDFQSVIESNLTQVKGVTGVVNVVSPFINPNAVSSDGKTAYALVQLKDGSGQIDKSILDRIATISGSINNNGLEVERAGGLIYLGVGEIIGVTEIIGVLIALMVLVITFGALIAAGMPLLIAILGVGISVAGLFSLSQVVNISSTTPVLSLMLGLAVGIDYSLFIISRYRNLLLEGHSYKDAAGRAIGTAGNAVIFAASTVIIALAALSVVNIPFMTTMGLAGAASIAIAALVAVSVCPAIFGIAGKNIFGKKTAAKIAEAQQKGVAGHHSVSQTTIWYKGGRILTRTPVVPIIFSLIVVALLAFPVTDLKLGLPNDEYAAANTTQKKAYDLLTNAFGVGFNAPLIVLADNVPPVTDADKAAVRSALTAAFQKQIDAQTAEMTAKFQKQAAEATTPELKAKLQQDIATAQTEGQKQLAAAKAQLETQIAQYSSLAELNKIATQLNQVSGVKVAQPASVTANGKTGIIQVIPVSAPSDQQTSDLITNIRTNPAKASGNPQVTLSVTGYTALQDDINTKLANALPVYLIVVVGLSLILLLIAFRSVLIPLKATIGFLFSVLSMFGASVAIFQWGWLGIADAAPIISFLPIITTGILFGLAMDYEFFLVSSMHEVYAKTGDPKQAVEVGFSMGAKVVTAAAAIMVAVFAGFIGNHDANIRSIGFSLALGVFVDAFIVRMTLVPTVMYLLGKSAWWIPKWLDKILPPVSIEGEQEEGDFDTTEVAEPVR